MRAGILTFHNANNYGAVLQAYALQQKLIDNNVDAKIIDYRLKEIDEEYRLFRVDLVKKMLKRNKYLEAAKILSYNCLTLKSRVKKKSRFNEFSKENLKITDRCKSYKDIDSLNYDAYICGSDQIWNSNITNKINDVYFCAFNKDSNVKKITYAASMGKTNYSKEEEKYFKENLKNLTHIGVREVQLKEYTKNFTDKKVVQVLDPTLLLKADRWKMVSKEYKIDKKYLLIYSLEINNKILDAAELIANEYDLQIVIIGNKSVKKESKYIVLDDIGPAEFLGVFENCEYVITNSFHGTCFSIINEKKFYTIPHSSAGARMISLLETLGIEKRLITDISEIDLKDTIDYLKVNKKLEIERQQSLQFLNNALLGDKNE